MLTSQNKILFCKRHPQRYLSHKCATNDHKWRKGHHDQRQSPVISKRNHKTSKELTRKLYQQSYFITRSFFDPFQVTEINPRLFGKIRVAKQTITKSQGIS